MLYKFVGLRFRLWGVFSAFRPENVVRRKSPRALGPRLHSDWSTNKLFNDTLLATNSAADGGICSATALLECRLQRSCFFLASLQQIVTDRLFVRIFVRIDYLFVQIV